MVFPAVEAEAKGNRVEHRVQVCLFLTVTTITTRLTSKLMSRLYIVRQSSAHKPLGAFQFTHTHRPIQLVAREVAYLS